MVRLQTLLTHARITTHSRHLWFTGALWRPPTLFVPEVVPGHLAFIERNYLPAMRELCPDMVLLKLVPPAAPARTSKPLYNTRLFKKPPFQGDLL